MKPVLAILGIGTAVPPHRIAQGEAAELAKELCAQSRQETRILPALYRRTRVERRGSVLLEPGEGAQVKQSFFMPAKAEDDRGPTTEERMIRYVEGAPALAIAASRRALTESKLESSRIRELITVSCTGFMAPGLDRFLIQEFGFSKTLGRTHVGFMGCHGAINGLRVASAFAAASSTAGGILLCSTELCSLHFYYGGDPEKMVANALFSDGAAALVGVPSAMAPQDAWRVAATGSCLFPDSSEAMTWAIGNHGFEMTLSAAVPGLISDQLRPWLEDWLGHYHLGLRDIRSWAVHPGGPRILDAVTRCLDLPDEAPRVSREILAEYGNMSSATLLFIVERLRARNSPRPCVAVGFGPGLVAEAALFL